MEEIVNELIIVAYDGDCYDRGKPCGLWKCGGEAPNAACGREG